MKSTLLFIYLLSIILTPWFHLHPGEYHTDSIGDFYHSHTEPFTSHSSEHNDNDHHEDGIMHKFAETITPLDDMLGFFQANSGNTINPAKSAHTLDYFNSTSPEISQNQTFQQNLFEFLIHQPQQDYCVQFATNLSPPQA